MVVIEMTIHAVRGEAGILATAVARIAVSGLVLTLEREPTVIERGALPTVRGITVAGLAVGGEPLLLVIRPLIVVLVAALAIGR